MEPGETLSWTPINISGSRVRAADSDTSVAKWIKMNNLNMNVAKTQLMVEALIDSQTLKKRCALVARTEIQETQGLWDR